LAIIRDMPPPGDFDLAEFDLAGWRVQPSLNRLGRGGTTVRLEPKMMDVLVSLARRAGQVVSKDELASAVWPDLYVTESVITRAIAGLRRALVDDAREPRFIETIAKRGYRLLPVPTPVAASSPMTTAPTPALAPLPPGTSPYLAGQWVQGAQFYGREALLAEVLHGPRNGVWLLGSRAVGKTSTLKQLAFLAAAEAPRRYLPLFWDLQGCAEPRDLDAGFHDALADAEERLAEVGLTLAELGADDFLAVLGRLRRALRARGLTLLLLVDEAEELLRLHEASPTLLGKLRRALLGHEGVRTVLAASSRLWQLAGPHGDTSPFLHGFAPPSYLGCLEEGAARRLVCQEQAPPAAATGIPRDTATVEQILLRCGNHPYLLQLLCTRYWQLGDLEAATAAVRADAGLRHLFAVDFELLTEREREVLTALAVVPQEGEDAGASPVELAAALLHLERLGVVRRTATRLAVASPILAEWLVNRAAPKL
jgi:DNA-binding winged helix-turn-helix (wHTH) protein